MADARVNSTVKTADTYPIWDLFVENGIVPILSGAEENQQRANIAAFIQVGTIPQLPDVGVDWTGFFVKRLSFGDLDTSLRQSLYASGCGDYTPSYDIVDDQFYTTIKRVTT